MLNLKKSTAFFYAILVFGLPLQALSQSAATWKNATEISCDGALKCLSQDEMKSLIGKTLKYRHSRFREMGYVYITLKTDGRVEGKNDKGSVSGSWEMKENAIAFKTDNWSEFSFSFFQVDQQIFMNINSGTGGATILPVAVS